MGQFKAFLGVLKSYLYHGSVVCLSWLGGLIWCLIRYPALHVIRVTKYSKNDLQNS